MYQEEKQGFHPHSRHGPKFKGAEFPLGKPLSS